MKKMFAMILSLMLVLSLAACGGGTSVPSSSAPASTPGSSQPTGSVGDGTYEIAMITDKGNIDDKSFNQGTWEGVKMYAEEKEITHQYYKPTEVSDDAYVASIDLAVSNGAKIVVTPGYLFENAIGVTQEKYPDVHFILIDSTPKVDGEEKIADNAVGITYAEEQAGYLAGYAAVKDGYTSLGFLGGMAVPAVVRYGFGFVQGANDAAGEMQLKVDMKYFYTGGFEAAPEWQSMAAGWYQGGTEVIFGCGGSVGNSVFAAAEASGAKSIGVDVDQSAESDTIITSAMKGLRESVYQTLDAFYNGSFPGGQAQVLGAAEEAVGLPMETSKFETFSQADYDTTYASIAAGDITILTDADSSDENPKNLSGSLDNVNLDYIVL